MADHNKELWHEVSDLLRRFRTARSEVAQLPELKARLDAAVRERDLQEKAVRSEARADLTEEERKVLQRRIEEIQKAPEVVGIYGCYQSVGYRVGELHEELESVLSRIRPRYKDLALYVAELRRVSRAPTITNLDRIIGLLQDMTPPAAATAGTTGPDSKPSDEHVQAETATTANAEKDARFQKDVSPPARVGTESGPVATPDAVAPATTENEGTTQATPENADPVFAETANLTERNQLRKPAAGARKTASEWLTESKITNGFKSHERQAEAMGLERSVYFELKAGRKVSEESYIRAARFLGCDPKDLMPAD